MAKLIEIQKYEEQRCPKCKSKDLDYDTYDVIDESFKQDVTCKKCGFEFTFWADKPEYWEVYTR